MPRTNLNTAAARDSQFDPIHEAVIEKPSVAVPQWRTVARLDPMAERIRQQIKNQMAAHKLRDQKALARRAKLNYADVNKFLRGGMPFPRLTFLNTLLSVFGYTLAQALADTMLPVKPLTPPMISRPLVLEIAAVLEDEQRWPDAHLEVLREMVKRRRRTRGR